ncbi:MAG TPA: HEAT repeat domain-containing protein [Gemmatimonadales bacterium]|nr:HEAT repeat domain-containing protein [Gemmatimonadales bacterium]
MRQTWSSAALAAAIGLGVAPGAPHGAAADMPVPLGVPTMAALLPSLRVAEPQAEAPQAEAPQAAEPRSEAPAPWLQGDPADTLYRAGRAALNARDYRRAADEFGRIVARYPKSGYAADALYWRAFALYRLGGQSDLHLALGSLRAQRDTYPKAATRGDAAALERRIQGELARRGDADAAQSIAEAARTIAETAAAGAENAAEATAAARADMAEAASELGRAGVAMGPGVVVVPRPPRAPRPPKAPKAPRSPRPPVVINGLGSDSRCAEYDDDIKVAALNALQQMDPARAAPILDKVLARRDSSSVCLRRKALFLVAQGQDSGAVDVLLRAARTDPDSEVRAQAVFWLSQVDTDRSVAALDSILRTTKDPEIQEKAVFALSQQGSPRAEKALQTYAGRDDVPEAARERAIFWLGQSGSEANTAFLRSLYGRLKNEELKKRVLFSVSQTGTPASGKWLVGIARNPAESLESRKQALFWAEQGGASTADLASIYTPQAGRELRGQVIFVLSQRGDSAAADKLIDIAKHDPDPELRKKAVFWLGQMDDPRIASVLQEILEQ